VSCRLARETSLASLYKDGPVGIDLAPINVLAELERIGRSYDFIGEAEVRVLCPFHDDKTPSCCINVEKKLFKCQTAGCGADGDIITFIAKALDTTRRVVFEEFQGRYALDQSKVIDPQVVERYHAAIWQAKPLLKELYTRGLTDDLIRKYRLGFYDGRITIPVMNDSGMYVNIRKYLPGAPGPEKMKNTRGHGDMRLYPVDQLKYDSVVVCGGELKAIVSASLLNSLGIGAVTATAGEGGWDSSFSERLKGKAVYVMMDIDKAGHLAADKVCARIRTAARWVGKVVLPLSPDKYPKGDINDWVGRENATTEDFKKLLDNTDEWVPKAIDLFDPNEEAKPLHLAEAVKAEITGKRIKVKAIVSAMDTAPYVVPREVMCVCSRNEESCSLCPLYAFTPDDRNVVIMEIPPESAAILEMVATTKQAQRDAIIAGLGMPDCTAVDFKPQTYYNVEDVRLSPQLEISNRTADHLMQPALCIGHGLELNEGYEFVGRMYPHPKTQQAVLLVSSYKATQDALSNYTPSNTDLEALKVFQPDEWTQESIQHKLDEVYEDLEANVTRIFQRRDLHLAVDLAFHTTLLISFDKRVVKGWGEVLVIGDSSQGKSETTGQLMNHYGLGEKMECKNATVAGLLGGLQQMNGRWFVTWGTIPTHDKRLVVLEELKGTSTEVIGKLTDMRSSGVAEIPKIEKRRTHARTRLIAVSNPRSDQPLSSYNFGVEAIKELIGGLEDVRRFDLIAMVSSGEVDVKLLNKLQRNRPKVEHRYTQEVCRRCILWSWTRAPEQVQFDDEAYAAILNEATRLCSIFTELVPIVDRGSVRYKIARMATSLACRTFSHMDGDLQAVHVRACHVMYITALMERMYSTSVFGYRDFSDAIMASEHLLEPDQIKVKILQTPFPADFVEQILSANEIELRDLCDWCGWDKGDGIQLLSFLVRKHALRRDGRNYRKAPPFIELLKSMRGSKQLKAMSRPDFIGETEEKF
jgi:hypothetical protein